MFASLKDKRRAEAALTTLAGILARVGDRSIPPRRSPILYAVVDNPLTFHRLAITDEQIGAYGLPTKPRKQGDRRPRQILETV